MARRRNSPKGEFLVAVEVVVPWTAANVDEAIEAVLNHLAHTLADNVTINDSSATLVDEED